MIVIEKVCTHFSDEHTHTHRQWPNTLSVGCDDDARRIDSIQ